jgi:hypothetical protein
VILIRSSIQSLQNSEVEQRNESISAKDISTLTSYKKKTRNKLPAAVFYEQ